MPTTPHVGVQHATPRKVAGSQAAPAEPSLARLRQAGGGKEARRSHCGGTALPAETAPRPEDGNQCSRRTCWSGFAVRGLGHRQRDAAERAARERSNRTADRDRLLLPADPPRDHCPEWGGAGPRGSCSLYLAEPSPGVSLAKESLAPDQTGPPPPAIGLRAALHLTRPTPAPAARQGGATLPEITRRKPRYSIRRSASKITRHDLILVITLKKKKQMKKKIV